MKKRMMRLLLELLKDSKRSDRELAKVLRVSQPTVSRMRKTLVREGSIKEFTVIPDFVRMGYEIMAISCAKFRIGKMAELKEKAEEWMHKRPNIIFNSRAQGMGKNAVMISLHKGYSDYVKFMSDLESDWGKHMEDWGSMLVDLTGLVLKPLSLKYLGEQQET